MNPNRFAEDRDYASDIPPKHSMGMNVFGRIFELNRQYQKISEAEDELGDFLDQCSKGEFANHSVGAAFTAVKDLMRALDTFEYAFPELREKEWFSIFQSDVHHTYWRIEDGRFDAAIDRNSKALDLFCGEVDRILSNVPESRTTKPSERLKTFLERYGENFSPHNGPDDYEAEIFEARDLFSLGYYSTGLLVLGRAVERSLLNLGRIRKVRTVKGYSGTKDWEDARFFERAIALSNADMPDESGKVISKRQYHEIQILIDFRNQVAHSEYRNIEKMRAQRLMGQSLQLLTELEQKRHQLKEMDPECFNHITKIKAIP